MQRTQELQKILDAKEYGHLSVFIAAALMLLVFCPMSILAVAAPYWTRSFEIHGITVHTSVSLWTISVSSENGRKSLASEEDMCADTMQGFDDCGRIHALRFFTITALLLSLASALLLSAAFSPILKERSYLRVKILLAGAILVGVVLIWNFLSMCIAASVHVDESSLNGKGFISIVLELLFVMLALAALAVKVWRQRSPSPAVTTSGNKDQWQQQRMAPTLLNILPARQRSTETDEQMAEKNSMCTWTSVVMVTSGQNSAEGVGLELNRKETENANTPTEKPAEGTASTVELPGEVEHAIV